MALGYVPAWERAGSGSSRTRSCCRTTTVSCSRWRSMRDRGHTSCGAVLRTVLTGTDYSFRRHDATDCRLIQDGDGRRNAWNGWGSWAFACWCCLTALTRERRWSTSVAVLIGPWRWSGAKRPPWSGRLSTRTVATPTRTTGAGRPASRSSRGSVSLKCLPALTRSERLGPTSSMSEFSLQSLTWSLPDVKRRACRSREPVLSSLQSPARSRDPLTGDW